MSADQIQKRNADLQAQFARCEQLGDADQWDVLGMAYFEAGFPLNAGTCFERAEACRQAEKAKRDWALVDVLVEKVFRAKPRFSVWDVALVLREESQAHTDSCVRVARSIIRQARRDGVIEILSRRSHYYRLADGVSMETGGAA